MTHQEEQLVDAVTEDLYNKLLPHKLDKFTSAKLIIFDFSETNNKTNFNPTKQDWLDLIQNG